MEGSAVSCGFGARCLWRLQREESDVSGGPQGSGDGFFQKAQAWKERIDSHCQH